MMIFIIVSIRRWYVHSVTYLLFIVRWYDILILSNDILFHYRILYLLTDAILTDMMSLEAVYDSIGEYIPDLRLFIQLKGLTK